MRRIETKQARQKKAKRNQMIVGIILICLMMFSIIGYSLSSVNDNNKNVEKYRDFRFEKQGQYWVLNLERQEFYFSYLPQEVENISVEGYYYLEDYYQEVLYFINSNPEIRQEILINMHRFIQRQQDACFDDSCDEWPIKTCEDNLIIYQEGEEKVYKHQNCVYIQGGLKSADAFIYKLLEII